MFTDRFIKIPVKEYNIQTKELTGNEGELRDNWEKINPFDIQSYRPDVDDDDSFYLTMKNREPFAVYMPIAEFEKMLNKI